MDLYKLAESLTVEEQNELYDIIYDKKKQRARTFAKGKVLSNNEKALIKSHQIVEAVKEVRKRLNCDFLSAKEIIDNIVRN